MAPVEAATLVLKAAYLVAALVRLYSSRQICLHLHGANGGIESRTTVESEPSEPNEDGTKEDQSGVVRLAVRWLTSTLALAQNKGVGQTCPAGSDVNGSTSGEVKGREVEKPSIGVPSPASDRAVDYGSPAEGKHQARQNASTFKRATDDDLNCASAEEQLVQTEDNLGNIGITRRRSCRDVLQTKVCHVTDEGRGSPRVNQRVSPEQALECGDSNYHDRLKE